MWDEDLSWDMPGMSARQVYLAGLLGKADAYLARQLSKKLMAKGVQSFRHLSDVFSRMNSSFVSVDEREVITAAVAGFFQEYQMAPEGPVQQWDTLVTWWEECMAYARPLGGRFTIHMDDLTDLSAAINQKDEFATVRSVGQFLITVVQRMVAENRLEATSY